MSCAQLTKTFGPVVANDRVDLTVQEQEIHAVLGENGAGKSTLMNCLAGFLQPDSGSILVGGRPVRLRNPKDAIRLGIGMVHQHFRLVPTFTITENVMLNDEPVTRSRLIDNKAATARVHNLAEMLRLDLDPDMQVQACSVAVQQKVEILKAIHRHARLLILDEPTAVLGPHEVRELIETLRRLRDEGTTIVLITHKLDEVLEIADTYTVLRAGRVEDSGPIAGESSQSLARRMVGAELAVSASRTAPDPGHVVLELNDVHAKNQRGFDALRGLTLNCHAREILGVAGVDGNGQDELLDVLTGQLTPTSGTVDLIASRTDESPDTAPGHSASFIPQDRQSQGLILEMTVAENLILGDIGQPAYSRWGVLRRGNIRRRCEELIDSYQIKGQPDEAVHNLSGGHQQKVVLARELHGAPSLIIAAQPTRGVDVAATNFILDELSAQRDRGAAVVLVSLDIQEIMSIADRIAVLYRGRAVASLSRAEATLELVGEYMTGVRSEVG